MPSVPNYGGRRRVEETPRAGRQVRIDAPREAFGIAQQSPLTNVLPAVTEMVQREVVRADRLAITEADNRLAAIEADLKLEAAQKFKGKDAMQATGWVQAERTKRLSEIEGTLNDRQKQFWKPRADRSWIDLEASLESHAAQEFERHETQEYAAGLQNRINAAVGDPTKAPALLAEGQAMARTFAQQRGIGREEAERLASEFGSKLHAGVIERMLTDGNDLAATAYMTANRDALVGADRLAVERKLEVASTEGAAMRAVDQVWQQLGPKDANAPLSMATMEEWIREQHADNPSVIKAARQELRARAEAWNHEQRERTAAASATVLGRFNTGASLAEIKRMPEYRALDGKEQAQITEYVTNRLWQQDSRNYELANRRRVEQERRQHANLWRYQAAPESVVGLSENVIRALEPTVGAQGVAALLDMKQRFAASPQAVRTATIDTELFKSVAEDAGFDYAWQTPSKLSDDQKATLGRLRDTVEAEIARQQQITKRELTRDEKQGVMQKVLDQKVMRDRWGGLSTEEVVAATVEPDERGEVYVPFDKIPPSGVTAALRWMRENGAIGLGIDDKTALAKFRTRFERAAGAQRAGASQDEINRILLAR